MTTYRSRVIGGIAPDQGWRTLDLDGLGPGERENALASREHLIQVRRNGSWFAASTWPGAMPADELAGRKDIKRLASLAEGIRGRAERPIAAAEAQFTAAKAAVESAKRQVGAAEDALKSLKAAQGKAEVEAAGVDKQVVEAEAELDRILRRQEPVAVG